MALGGIWSTGLWVMREMVEIGCESLARKVPEIILAEGTKNRVSIVGGRISPG
jgi:hypothetical protein